jgi:hypothetical protein
VQCKPFHTGSIKFPGKKFNKETFVAGETFVKKPRNLGKKVSSLTYTHISSTARNSNRGDTISNIFVHVQIQFSPYIQRFECHHNADNMRAWQVITVTFSSLFFCPELDRFCRCCFSPAKFLKQTINSFFCGVTSPLKERQLYRRFCVKLLVKVDSKNAFIRNK